MTVVNGWSVTPNILCITMTIAMMVWYLKKAPFSCANDLIGFYLICFITSHPCYTMMLMICVDTFIVGDSLDKIVALRNASEKKMQQVKRLCMSFSVCLSRREIIFLIQLTNYT